MDEVVTASVKNDHSAVRLLLNKSVGHLLGGWSSCPSHFSDKLPVELAFLKVSVSNMPIITTILLYV